MSQSDKRIDWWDMYGMKLSQDASMRGISYRTALRWWKAGQLRGYQAPTSTTLIKDQTKASATIVQRVAISLCPRLVGEQ
jgi:predicted site-specific integrase-resolvase